MLQGGAGAETDYTGEVSTHAGQRRLIHWRHAVITGEDGRIEGLLVSGEDITERETAARLSAHQAALNELLIGVSRELFAAPPATLDTVIESVLQRVAEHCGVDRAGIYAYDPASERVSNTHEWRAASIAARLGPAPGAPDADLRIWLETLKADRPVVIESAAALDPSRAAEKAFLRARQIRSMAAVPLCNALELGGFLVLDSVRDERRWSADEIRMLRLFGDLLSLALRNRDARRQLESSEFRWKFALEGSAQGVWDWDAETDRVYYSSRWKQMLGYRDEEIAPELEEWSKRVHPNDLPTTLAAVQAHLEGDTPTYSSEHRVRHKNGEYRWMLDRGLVVARDADGRALRVIGTHTDVTQRVESEQRRLRMERELQQTRKMEALGQLTGGVAHEFNNMLAVMLGHTGLLRRHLPRDADPRLGVYIDHIEEAGDRAKDLIRQMLSFSRPRERQPQRTALDSAVQEALTLVQGSLPSSIEIDYRAGFGLADVLLDAGELQQLLTNLLVNARDAMEGKGRIDVAVGRYRGGDDACLLCHAQIRGDWLELSVTDNGPGIAEADLARMFEPFYTTKSVGQGTGLGLSVVQGIVEHSGGHVLVETHPGTGTRFRLLFPPVERVHAAAPAEATPAPAASRLQGRVLVVDDEPLLTMVMHELLQDAGLDVSVRNDSREALALLLAHDQRFDVLITDQTMPGVLGTELTLQAKAQQPALKVILCTGHSDLVNERNAAELGIDRYLTKPADPEILIRSVAELLSDIEELIDYTHDQVERARRSAQPRPNGTRPMDECAPGYGEIDT